MTPIERLETWLRCRASDCINEYTEAEQDYIDAAKDVERMRVALERISSSGVRFYASIAKDALDGSGFGTDQFQVTR